MTAVTEESERIVGALAGWRRKVVGDSTIVILQVAATKSQFDDKDFHRITLALNDRQLRSLARDLSRAAGERNMTLWAKKPWYRFWKS